MRSGQRMSHGQSEVFLSRDVPHLPGQGSADQSPAGEKSGDKAGLSFPLNSGCQKETGAAISSVHEKAMRNPQKYAESRQYLLGGKKNSGGQGKKREKNKI